MATTDTFEITCTAATISGVADSTSAPACNTNPLVLLGTLTTNNADGSTEDIKKVYQLPSEWIVNDVFSLQIQVYTSSASTSEADYYTLTLTVEDKADAVLN